jgi:hypothetical protein
VSSVFPLVAVNGLRKIIGNNLFPESGVQERVRIGIYRLQAMELREGGLTTWQGGQTPWVWASIYATHFLIEARIAGHDVPEDFLRRLLTYVQRQSERNLTDELETSAYASYVLARAGQPNITVLNRLSELLKVDQPASAWLAAAWAAAGRQDLALKLLPERLAPARENRRYDGDIASPVRDRAVQILALLEAVPKHPSLPQLVRELSLSSSWYSTQDTAFAVLALGRWLQQAEPMTPYERVELRLAGQVVAQAEQGAPLEWQGDVTQPMELLVFGKNTSVAHVEWSQRGVPLVPPANEAHGLSVQREWYNEAGQLIENRDLLVGELIQVRITASSANKLQQIVMEDVLPAGFDIENPRLATSAAAHGDNFTNQSDMIDARDDRLIVVGNMVNQQENNGRYIFEHRYLMRAVVAGTFVRPPVRAECMYDSSLNAVEGSGSVVIKARVP